MSIRHRLAASKGADFDASSRIATLRASGTAPASFQVSRMSSFEAK
ncbi:hypothetical protein [Frondihabitans sp. PAMC 28766]|nr:hypothetical protein [Frondihabitans sp. PAMC 28766]